MPKTIVFIKNQEDPSSYYRLYQYLSGKKCRFIECVSLKTYRWYYNSEVPSLYKKIVLAAEHLSRVTFFCIYDRLIWKSKNVIVNRKLFPRRIPFYGSVLLEWYLQGKKLYWDFDDNIIADGEITKQEADVLGEKSEKIIVTNAYLKSTVSDLYQNKVILMPTTDLGLKDYKRESIEKERLDLYKKELRLIWLGSKNNLIFLEDIIPLLDEYAGTIIGNGRKIRLLVVSNKAIVIETKAIRIENIQWDREEALRQLRTAHIGLMPLRDDEYTQGKGGFKAVQYLGMGIPAIVSDVGFNTEVVDSGENGFVCRDAEMWKSCIAELCNNADKWLMFSGKARNKWEDTFNPDIANDFWTSVIQTEF